MVSLLLPWLPVAKITLSNPSQIELLSQSLPVPASPGPQPIAPWDLYQCLVCAPTAPLSPSPNTLPLAPPALPSGPSMLPLQGPGPCPLLCRQPPLSCSLLSSSYLLKCHLFWSPHLKLAPSSPTYSMPSLFSSMALCTTRHYSQPTQPSIMWI